MKKKVIAALLTSAMAVSLLAGCGTTVESTGSSQSTSTTETKKPQLPLRPRLLLLRLKLLRKTTPIFPLTLPYGLILLVNGAIPQLLIP